MILRLVFVDSVSRTIYPPCISAFWALGFGFAASTMSATFINGVLGPQIKPVILRQQNHTSLSIGVIFSIGVEKDDIAKEDSDMVAPTITQLESMREFGKLCILLV